MSGPVSTLPGTNNPKLQSVNYVSILPEGKTSGYKPNQQIDYKIDPIQYPYVDGQQSYLLLNVTPSGTFSNTNATADAPLAFPPNMGANSLVNRLVCRVNDGTGRIIEDRENYNQYNGIMNAYMHDSDVFPSLAKVEGVTGRNTDEINLTINNINNCYFYPQADTDTTANVSVGGKSLQQNSFVIPVQLGLFSAFSNQHFAVPNMDVGGVNLTYHLEKADRCLQLLCHRFFKQETINGVANCNVEDAVNPLTKVAVTFDGGSGALFKVDKSVCDCDLEINEEVWTLDNLAWRIGMPIEVNGNVGIITDIQIVGGQIEVTLSNDVTTPGATETAGLDSIGTRDYTIDKCELRCLVTMPDAPTMKQIRRAVMNGINFNSTSLYKVSTASNLKNAVVDIPESLTRALSIMAVPCQQANLDSVDQANSYVYPRPDSIINDNTNDYSYQWLVRQVLIPNLQVETNKAVDNKNDNAIFFNQQFMAMRPMFDVRSLGDNTFNRLNKNIDLELPYFFPILLAPEGSSFDLIDSAPQLRVENVSATDTSAKLYFVFVNHTRLLKVDGNGGVQVEM